MSGTRAAKDHDVMRLDQIASHLGIAERHGAPEFREAVVQACLGRIQPILQRRPQSNGEGAIAALAHHFCVIFEEVRGPGDVAIIEDKYLRKRREIGFARLRDELRQPGVDALLFQRLNAAPNDADRWVAVINLQETRTKSYWNRCHELAHRIAEPPQLLLPFRRHRFEAANPVESLVDLVAAEIGYYAEWFRPLVASAARRETLTFGLVERLRNQFAPSGSILATMKAVTKHWPRPAVALTARVDGRKNARHVDRALRVTVQAYSSLAKGAGLSFFPNMRVPESSPIQRTFRSGANVDEKENLGEWTTSTGGALQAIDVFTSARDFGQSVYVLISA
jgi:hypothetical protein